MANNHIQRSSHGSWGRIIIGHIICVISGGVALLAFAFTIFDKGYLAFEILLIILGLAGLLYGFMYKSSGREIEVDPKTGRAVKKQL